MDKKFLFFILLFVFSLTPVFSAVTTNTYNLKVQVIPYQNKTATIIINYTYSGTNSMCIPLVSSCGQALFFRVYVYDQNNNLVQQFRTGKSGCMVGLSDTSCDIPYKFDGSTISGSTVNTITLSNYGNYVVNVQFAINVQYGSDITIAEQKATFSIQPAVTPTPTPQNVTNVTNATFVSTSPNVDVGLRAPITIIPTTIYEGDTVSFKIPIYLIVYSGGPYGPFLEFRIKDQSGNTIAYYRAGDQGVTTNPSTNYYFNYQPQNVERRYDIVFNWTASTAGNYTLTVKPKYSVQYWFDYDLGPETTILKFSVNKRVNVTPTPTPITVTTTPQVVVRVGQVVSIPDVKYVGSEVKIYVPVTLIVISGGEYGPFLEFRIKDTSGNVVAYYRAGDQGVTTSSSTNYYFNYYPTNIERFYNISLTFVPSKAGAYYLTLKPRYSVKNAPDYDLGPETTIYAFTVQSGVSPAGLCTDQPPISWTAWMIGDSYVTSVPVGRQVNATVMFVNPKSNCKYVGTVKIDIRKELSLRPDQSMLTQEIPIEISPGGSYKVVVPFTPSEDGTYHYDVYYTSQYTNYKYTAKDVAKIYGTPGTDFAGPKLDVTSQPSAIISVVDYYFKQYDQRTTTLVEGVDAYGCVVLTSKDNVTATITVKVYGYNSAGAEIDSGPGANLKATETKQVTFTPGTNVTVCAKFVPQQTSMLHPEQYYLRVFADGKDLGTYPSDKRGATIEKKEDFIKTQLVVINSSWYDSAGNSITKGTWTSGTFYVRTYITNKANATLSTTIKTTILTKGGGFFGLFAFKTAIQECSDPVTLEPNQIKMVECSVDLGDGKYYYEVYADKDKIYTGPEIVIGVSPYIQDLINKIIAGLGVGGVILLILFIFFGPYIMMGLYMMLYAGQMVMEWMMEMIQKLRRK